MRPTRPTPMRPRQPGERPGPGASPLDPRWIIALALGMVAVATGGLFLLNRNQGGTDPTATAAGAVMASAAAHDPTLPLPLTLADVGFDGGTIQENALTEGPGAVTWCNGAVDPIGLDRWRANRLTADDGNRRVGQLVARFDSGREASAYLDAVTGQLACGSWATTTSGQTVRFTVGPDPGGPTVGDETRRVDLEVTGEGPPLHLRTVWCRLGADVTQLTLVALDSDDLPALEADALAAMPDPSR